MTTTVLLVWHADDTLLGVFADSAEGRAAAEAMVASERAEYERGQTDLVARLRAEDRPDLISLIDGRPLASQSIRIEVVDVLHAERP